MTRGFHVVVIGAGPAGLAAALSLSKLSQSSPASPIRITVLELRTTLQTLGGAVNLTPLALRYLESLGVGSHVSSSSIQSRSLDMLSQRTGKLNARLWPNAGNIRVNRDAMVRAMVEGVRATPEVTLHYGAVVSNITEVGSPDGEGCVKVEFRVGDASNSRVEVLEADVLLGCDGIHSFVRAKVVDPERTKVFSNKSGVYGYVELAKPADAGIQRSDGQPAVLDTSLLTGRLGSLLISFFEPSRTKLYLAGVISMEENTDVDAKQGWKAIGDDKEALKRGMLDKFSTDKLPGIKDTLERCNDWFFYPVYMLPPDGAWTRGRVLLLGDAAHAMPPQGESTGIAIEDGVLFSHIFSRRDTRSIARMLGDYEAVRRDEINRLYKDTVFRWSRVGNQSWLMSLVMEWFTWLVVSMMNLKQKDYFARDVTKLALPE